MSFVTFKYTHFENPTRGRPDNVSSAVINTAVGTHIDIEQPRSARAAHGAQAGHERRGQRVHPAGHQPIRLHLERCADRRRPRGRSATTFDEDNFFRDAGQVAYNLTLSGKGLRHNIHAGYQQYIDSEDLIRSSNGWGSLTVPGGGISFNGTPIFYQATFQAQGIGLVPKIHSEYQSKSFEVNDAITWKNFTFNLGLLASNDTLYGQGLQKDDSTLSGFVKATGTTSESRKYKMYNVPFSKMLQPRLSTTWAYNQKDTVFVSYARYNPAASSLPRAASWDRNLRSRRTPTSTPTATCSLSRTSPRRPASSSCRT